jgi:two-component system, chemotaxis family, chemotaxis protein CheY
MSSILLIDDNPEARTAMHRALGRAGYAVTTARDGIEGGRLFREIGPDLVIVDMVMPHKEGVATILDIRAAAPEARILAVSGGGGFVAGDILRIAELLGADATIEKPFSTAVLLAAVRRSLAPDAAAGAPNAPRAGPTTRR